ncbi:hypothetical protein CN481_04860 [Bacillus sp. AFS006103]|nr:hypothetical protein CN481_04860 [Bacillus sp. AFS006103]
MRQLFRLKGVTYEGRQRIIERLSIYDDIYIKRDYYNSFDGNAIGVFNSYGESIGWIPREIAEWLAPRLDNERNSRNPKPAVFYCIPFTRDPFYHYRSTCSSFLTIKRLGKW